MTVYDKVIPNSALESLAALTIGVCLVIGFDFAMKLVRSRLTDDAGKHIERDVSLKLFHYLERNYELSNQRQIGSIVNTVREFDSLKEFISSASFMTFADLPFIVLFLAVLAAIGGWIAAVPAVIVIATLAIGLLAHPRLQKLSANISQESQSKQSILIELLAHMETIKTLAGIDLLRNRWIDSVEAQAEHSGESKRINQFSSVFAMTGQQLSQVGVVVVGTLLITFGDLTLGGLIACVILSGRTLSPLGQLTNLLGRLSQALNAYKALDHMLGRESREETQSVHTRVLSSDLAFSVRGATLKYEGTQSAALGPIDQEFTARSSWGIVGPTGSGKTSLLRLLSGVSEPHEGLVLIGGTNIQHIHPQTLRENICIIHQQPAIFTGTIEENIRLGNPSASDEEIQKATQLACLTDFINNLEDGVKTHLFDRGSHLSGGQRQLIGLARLFVSNAGIVMLDEPTSALDGDTERDVLNHLTFFLKDKLAIIVTHRPALLKLTQHVLVLHQGQIVKRSLTSDLMKQGQKA